MEDNKDVGLLIKKIANATGLNQEEIAKRINYTRETLSRLKKTNDQKIYVILEKEFGAELNGVKKPGQPGDSLNEARALLKMLYQRVAKLESERLGLPIDQVMDEMDRDTIIARNDLEGKGR